MIPEHREHFRRLIANRRERSVTTLESLERNSMRSTMQDQSGDLSAYSFHMADQGSDTMERERTFSLASREGRYLHHLEEALSRIENGTYGICRTCGDVIGRARLEAVPHTTQCIECKNREERRGRGIN